MICEENWPVEYGAQLVLGDVGSNMAICCLWSRRDHIRKLVDRSRYCVIGNLYSRAGINAMLRNILSNPSIRYIVLTGRSLTDSDEALLKFFSLGIDQEWRIIGNGGQIDPGFPRDVLEDVRKSVRVIDLRGSRGFANGFEKVSRELPTLPPFAEPRFFPKTVPIQKIYPSEFLGFVVRQQSIVQAWEEILWTIMTFGEISPTDYGLEQREILGLLSIIQKPEPHPGNLPDWAPFCTADIQAYVEAFLSGRKVDEVPYSYGDRLSSYWGENQVDNILRELERSKHSRRAVSALWDPRTDFILSEPPCITVIQVAVRQGQLYLMAYIRSNDMFRAYPPNAFALAALQMRLASALKDVQVGTLSILSFSAHIYSDCWDDCQKVALAFRQRKRPFQQDLRGSFVLGLEDAGLVAEHFSPKGDSLQVLRAANERQMRHLLTPFVGRIDHAFYLGRESCRLGEALSSGSMYEQDSIE